MSFFTSVIPTVSAFFEGLDWLLIVKAAAFAALVLFLLGGCFRLLFGRGSALTAAVSATISVSLIYLADVLLACFLPELQAGMEPLPFLTVTSQQMFLTAPFHLTGDAFYSAVLRLSILAFLVNLLEEILPRGEKFLSWYLWRTATVLVALGLYVVICGLLRRYLPQALTDWAKYMLIGFWSVILLTGLLKILLTLILTVVNPVIGALYALFFSNLLGRQISKSILTTVLATAMLSGLCRWGFTQFAFSQFSLAAYGPTCLILLIVLYLFGKFL